MMRTYEGMIDQRGRVQLLEPIKLPPMRRILITVLYEEPELIAREMAMLSEAALAVDWLTLEEDAAWSHLAQINQQAARTQVTRLARSETDLMPT